MRKFLILLLIIFPYYSLQAQNTTNSPTSMYGIGEIAYGEGGQYAGLGGAGIALRSGSFINYNNPSAISALDSARFIFDMGVKGSYRIYRQTGGDSRSFVGNLNNMSIGFRMKPYLAASVFLTPVSSCGYAVTGESYITGTSSSTITSLFEGSGGLSKAGVSIAYSPFRNLSVGASTSYVAGTITQSETQSTAAVSTTSRKRGFYMDFGTQYSFQINKRSFITVGAVYAPTRPLSQTNTLTTSSSSGGTTVVKSTSHGQQYLPGYYGVGVSYAIGRWMFLADYRYYDWSKTKSNVSNLAIKNQSYLMIGAQHLFGNLYRNPLKLMMGAGINNSYVVISGKKAENYYVSAGLNMVFRGGNALTLGFKYNDQFNSAKNMQHDRAITAYLNISFMERVWHSKIQ